MRRVNQAVKVLNEMFFRSQTDNNRYRSYTRMVRDWPPIVQRSLLYRLSSAIDITLRGETSTDEDPVSYNCFLYVLRINFNSFL